MRLRVGAAPRLRGLTTELRTVTRLARANGYAAADRCRRRLWMVTQLRYVKLARRRRRRRRNAISTAHADRNIFYARANKCVCVRFYYKFYYYFLI